VRRGWGWAVQSDAKRLGRASDRIRAFVAASPWITLLVLLLMLHLASGTLTASEGVLFDLPESSAGEGEHTSLVALVLPMPRETLVFFDDARYVMGDVQSESALREQLTERSSKMKEQTLLVLADHGVKAAELFALAALARQSGIERLLFAEKRSDVHQETR